MSSGSIKLQLHVLRDHERPPSNTMR